MTTEQPTNPQGTIDEGTNPQQEELLPQSEVLPEEGQEEKPITLPSDDTFEMPEKFNGKSPEEIARAYVELEKKLGGKQDEQQPQQQQQQQQQNEGQESPQDELAQKYSNAVVAYINGEDVDINDLAETFNVPVSEVQDRLEYEKFKATKAVEQYTSDIGGLEEYKKTEAWALEHLPQEELEAFKIDFQNASVVGKRALVKYLHDRYVAANVGTQDSPAQDFIGGSAPKGKGKGYKSAVELQTDMADPRYGNDREYTKMVEEKLAATPEGVL